MENNFINNFITNLKSKHVNKTNLYKNNCSSVEYSSKDVISNVCNQVKAIQNADKLIRPVRNRNEFNMYSKGGFLPVSKMSLDQRSKQKQPAEFETQCVSDTQLINIVEYAESLIEGSKHIPEKTDITTKKDLDVHRQHTDQYEDVEKDSENVGTYNNDVIKCDHSVSKMEKRNESTSTEIVNMEVDFNNQLIESPKSKIYSPILKTNSPTLVFNLESFENFESIAMPVVKENLDFEAAKEVINSQLSKELFVQTHAEPVLYDRDKSLSPIFELKATNVDDLKENTITQMKNGMYIIDDDILLSNDEENDIKNNKELPLTCALETSFYDKDNLDEIMYVGFQTASNKSIYVPTESYSKARIILDEKIDGLPLTKLVEIFDKSYNNSVKEQNTVSSKKIVIDNNNTLSVGNKTAYEKPLKISQKSLFKNKILLPNIDSQFTEGSLLSDNKIEQEDKSKYRKEREKEIINCTKSISEQIHIDDHIIAEFENNFLVESEQNLKDDFTLNVTKPAKNNKNLDFTAEMDTKTKNLPHYSHNHKSIGGFKTANNNNIIVTDTGLGKMKNIFEDIDLKDLTNVANDVNKENLQNFNFDVPSTSRQFVGFKTANNRIIKVSELSLAKTKNIFDNINSENVEKKYESTLSISNNIKEKNNNVTSTLKNSKLCPRESCKPLELDNDNAEPVLSKGSKELITEILKETAKPNDCFENLNLYNENKTSSSGFRTASNKPVTISKELLNKSKKIFQDIDIEIDKNYDFFGNKDNFNLKNGSHDKFKGFSTANNKILPISKNALLKSKKILQDIDEGDINVIDHIKENNLDSFKGFKTASNKPVKISVESLAKSKDIFQDIDVNNDDGNSALIGFKTASNKRVTISNTALAKTKSIFNDIDIESTSMKDSKVLGFKTSTKSITIHENALNKTQNQKSPTFDGFKTANNNPVKISKDAFVNTKDKFQDLNIEMNDINTDRNFSGFQTASNKKVQISEEALLQSRKIFNEIEQYQNEPTKENEYKMETAKNNVDIDFLFNTEVAKDFEESFFIKEIPRSKRSGSPILSVPKAKKRKKFVIPQAVETVSKVIDTEIKKPIIVYEFDDNYKKDKKYNLRDIKEIEKSNNTEAKLDPYILNFQFDSLLDFEFGGKRNDIDNDRWTIDKIKKLFTDSVNKKIIPENWLNIQLRLIIWKLLSYEIVFPKTMTNMCTIKNVLHQLKYRYDRELYNVVRPPIRKILEKDEIPGKMIVLCVVGFYIDGVSVNSVTSTTQNIELLLTDGWYTIKAYIDRMIDKLICDGRIVVGTKLFIHGAELLNCEQGISPWEDTSSVRLKIYGNSIKCAKWDTRLGFHGNGAILSRLSTVKVNGGKVSRLRTFVTRVYPMMYVEKFDNGNTVTRSERLEHLYQMKFETERQIELEKLYEEVEKYSEQEEDSEGFNGTQICKLMKSCRAPSQFRACLTDTQINLLQEHNNNKREKLIENLQRKVEELTKTKGLNINRNVVPLLKIRVVDVEKDNISKAMLTIWRPNESLLELLKEGTCIDIYNVVPTAIRYSELQISAGRQSIFKKSNYNITKQTFKRKPYTIKDINPITTDYNEVDTAGFIFLIEPSTKEFESSKQFFQNVYLSDENKNIIIIIFWGGIKKFGFENILEIGQIVSCVNLEIRHGNTKKSIPQFRATEFTYFTKTCKIDELRQSTELLINKFIGIDKKKFIDDCVACKSSFSNFKYGNTDTPLKINNSDFNISKNKQFIVSPLVDTNILRKKKVDDKISKLQMYGEPPPLQTINLINKSNVIYNSYRSPLPSDTSVRNLPQNSPVSNGTFVKKLNPVKLSFAEEDPFAEDFDPSPPLSLE